MPSSLMAIAVFDSNVLANMVCAVYLATVEVETITMDEADTNIVKSSIDYTI